MAATSLSDRKSSQLQSVARLEAAPISTSHVWRNSAALAVLGIQASAPTVAGGCCGLEQHHCRLPHTVRCVTWKDQFWVFGRPTICSLRSYLPVKSRFTELLRPTLGPGRYRLGSGPPCDLKTHALEKESLCRTPKPYNPKP